MDLDRRALAILTLTSDLIVSVAATALFMVVFPIAVVVYWLACVCLAFGVDVPMPFLQWLSHATICPQAWLLKFRNGPPPDE